MKNIKTIAKKIGIKDDEIMLFGNYMAKINYQSRGTKKGKLVLVTAINPTPSGEGKTTMSIGISDAINRLNKKSIAVLREPSLGPVFGSKGGATGAGASEIVPTQRVNLHFTGDIHAISSANNLISAVIDNHIYQGNDLDIKDVWFKRAIDMNDRSLRGKFIITAASEIMSILSLASSCEDLKERLDSIIFGVNSKNKPIFVKELNITDALLILLRDAIHPNLVQSKVGNPIIIHGGPFANISHGTSSLLALRQGLSFSDFVITEAGFGADLGAEKFINIFSKQASKNPDIVVLVATVKGLIHQGRGKLEDGICHLKRHVENLTNMNLNFIVALNKFTNDDENDINYIKEWCENNNINFEVADVFNKKISGTKKLAEKIIDMSKYARIPKTTYFPNETTKIKIGKIAKSIYHADKVIYSDDAIEKIKWLNKNNIKNNYICIAKTPSSFSDNPKLLGAPKSFDIKVNNISISNGAKYIVVECGSILRMPGLGKVPRAETMKFESIPWRREDD